MAITLNKSNTGVNYGITTPSILEQGANVLASAFGNISQMAIHWDMENSKQMIDGISWQAASVRQKAEEDLMLSIKNGGQPPADWGSIVEQKVSDFVRGQIGSVPVGRMADGFYNSVMQQQQADKSRLYGMETKANMDFLKSKSEELASDKTKTIEQKNKEIESLFRGPDGKPTRAALMAFGTTEGGRNTALATIRGMIQAGEDISLTDASALQYSNSISFDDKDPVTGESAKALTLAVRDRVNQNKVDINKMSSEIEVIKAAIDYNRRIANGETVSPGDIPKELIGVDEDTLKSKIAAISGSINGKNEALNQLRERANGELFQSVAAEAMRRRDLVFKSGKGSQELAYFHNYLDKWLNRLASGDDPSVSTMTEKGRIELIEKLRGVMDLSADRETKQDLIRIAINSVLSKFTPDKDGEIKRQIDWLKSKGASDLDIKDFEGRANQIRLQPNAAEEYAKKKKEEAAISFKANISDEKERAKAILDFNTEVDRWTQFVSGEFVDGDGISSSLAAFESSQKRMNDRWNSYITNPSLYIKNRDNKTKTNVIDYKSKDEIKGQFADFQNIDRYTAKIIVSDTTIGDMKKDYPAILDAINKADKVDILARGTSKSYLNNPIPVKNFSVDTANGKKYGELIPIAMPVRIGSLGLQSEHNKSSWDVRMQPAVAVLIDGKVVGYKFLSENASNGDASNMLKTSPPATALSDDDAGKMSDQEYASVGVYKVKAFKPGGNWIDQLAEQLKGAGLANR